MKKEKEEKNEGISDKVFGLEKLIDEYQAYRFC